jgi:hypothetical protein
MTRIFDLRGTHGSGKSYIVHQLLKLFGNRMILDDKSQLIGHHCYGLDLAVIGPYTKVCGGCDAVKTQDAVEEILRSFIALQYPNILLEGSLVGHTYERYANLATELKGQGVEYKFLFLNTPLEECVRRVLERRKRHRNRKNFLPDNVKRDHFTTQTRLPKRFKDAGYDVTTVDWGVAVNQVAGLIMEE